MAKHDSRVCKPRRVLIAATTLFLNACNLNACNDPYWGQAHFDVANAGTILVGTKPALPGGGLAASVGPVAYASPVVAPDGTVWVSTWRSSAGSQLGEGELVHLAASGAPSVLTRSGTLLGQLSTPAIDGDGNVYVTSMSSWNGGSGASTVRKFDKNLNQTKSTDIVGVALSAPKIFDKPGTWSFSVPAILQTYLDYNGGTHVLLLGKSLDHLADLTVCTPEAPSVFSSGFRVQGVDLGAPYPENPSIAVRTVSSDRGEAFYLVAAGNRCGVTIYRFNPGNSAQLFTEIKHHGSGAQYFSSPAISATGVAVITDSDKNITAYNCITGDQLWQTSSNGFLAGSPILDPSLIAYAYVASYTHLMKIELSTGKIVKLYVTNTSPNPAAAPVSIDGSPSGSGGHIFVSTSAGLITYDYNLAWMSFAPMKGGQSAPAISSKGDVVVASTDGNVFRFPGP